MKVDIITCSYAYNYGAVLQTYALSQYLTEQNCEVKVINYQPNYARATNNKNTNFFKKIIRKPDYIKGKKVFTQFLKNNVRLTEIEYKNNVQLKDNPPIADVYIAGSDQIWNCDLPNGYDNAFFLDFVPQNKKKISYAASIAMDKISNEQKKRFKEMLRDFDKISVRENTAVEILKDANIHNVYKVLDPVFLISLNQWKELSKKEQKEKDRYILIYGFNRQKNVFEYAKQKAKEMKCKIFSVNTHIEDFFINRTNKYFWNVTPEKFINLIENAEMIITNSFHGLAFSILFKKNVKIFLKKGGANSRMLDLLKELSMEDLIYDNNYQINYESVENKLIELRRNSYDFFKSII